jgi:DhnA family fructose-bisphosphate aldolase class Ia
VLFPDPQPDEIGEQVLWRVRQLSVQGLKGGNDIIPLVAIDHGITNGPAGNVQGHGEQQGISGFLEIIHAAGIRGVIAHAGLLKQYANQFHLTGLNPILHLHASVEIDPALATTLRKKLIYDPVATAEQVGATAISLHINVRDHFTKNFGKELAAAAKTIHKAHTAGLPVLVMAYPRKKVKKRNPATGELETKIVTITDPSVVAHSARLAAEIGADIVKIPACDPIEQLPQVTRGCFVPVLLAGGEVAPIETLQHKWEIASLSGAAGVVLGRNAFMSEAPGQVAQTAVETFAFTPSLVNVPVVGESPGKTFEGPFTEIFREPVLRLVTDNRT